jgi:hypothetical protein
MTKPKGPDYAARDVILKLLSDDENAKVSTAEGAAALAGGEEYVDLEHLDQGVQRAKASMTKLTTGRVIPRGAVREETWGKIVAKLGSKRAQ